MRRVPWMTYGLIAANVIIFLRTPASAMIGIEELSLGDLCRQEAFFGHYGAIPDEMLHNTQLPLVPTGEVGAGQTCVIGAPSYEKIPALSVLYSMFLHGGWLHLLGNMLFLFVFGNNIEDRWGKLRFLAFYLITGYIAAYGFALANPDATVPLVGASGAVSGVLGAYLILYPGARVWSLVPILLFIPLKLPAWIVLGTWFVLQYLYATGSGVTDGGSVAYLAHVIGFAFGVLIAIVARAAQPPPPRHDGPPPPIVYSKRHWR
ncbi:rhomboid family intramembrane serine protease [Rhizocola hellebori]|uniref:rhomboid family intramembrane serine protease n=1 Tax=Rhizocola hellebori TaxID=1392758 RepID=UPI0019440717|nr:rhomboid family intramembrane serine protease [Rhizocola hellebori]